jgi:nitrate reductase delta subunit
MKPTDALADRFAALLAYPDESFPTALAACRAALRTAAPAAAPALERFACTVAAMSVAELRERYVEAFDMNPRCALDVGWHLHGESYDRGRLLASLRDELSRAGIDEGRELPDHLPTLLRLIDRASPPRAAELAGLIAPAIVRIHASLESCGSPYAHLLASIAASAAEGG